MRRIAKESIRVSYIDQKRREETENSGKKSCNDCIELILV